MAFSRSEPMYYLRDYMGVKAGTPVRFKMAQLTRLRLLAAKGVIGTKADMDSKPAMEARIAEQSVSKVEPKEEPKVEEKVEEVKEEVPEEPKSEEVAAVSIEKQEPKKTRKKKGK